MAKEIYIAKGDTAFEVGKRTRAFDTRSVENAINRRTASLLFRYGAMSNTSQGNRNYARIMRASRNMSNGL